MQNKKNSKIISKLVLSTTAAFMATMAVKATEEPNDVQSQVENFQQKDQLQVAYAKGDTIATGVTDNGVKYAEGDSATVASVTGCDNSKIPTDGCVKIDSNIGDDNDFDSVKDVSVTAIAEEAFKDCDKLVSVDIPSTVETIGNKAFDGCTKLEYVNIGETRSLDNWSTNIFGSAKSNVKRVYIEDKEKIKSVATKLGIDKSKVAEYTELAKDVVSATSVSVPEATENGIEFEITHNKNGNVDMYAIYRTDGVDTELIGIKYASNLDSKIEVIDTTKAEFGKKYTYKVVPYDINPSYNNFLTVENFETFENDIFGLSTKSDSTTTINFDYNQYTVDDITSTYTEVDVDGKTVKGAYSDIGDSKIASVYSIAKNRYAVNFGNGKPATVSGSDINELSDPLLYVREWDIKDDSTDKDAWEKQASSKTENKISSAGVSRVFSLQVVQEGTDSAGAGVLVVDDDECADVVKLKSGSVADEIPVYIQIDESWGSNLGAVAVSETNQDTVLENISILSDAERIKAGLPEGRYAKLVLDKFYYGPYAIYADKLENAGTSNSELCKTCGKSKDECTCKKDECPCDDDCACKKEDGTCECGKNDCKCTGTSSSTSHGYKTGDVASAGLLQAAFGMLAAAGSTLMGLFRKKKDRE